MNLLGEVSPGSIYSYIDRSLGAWDEQRPLFKANISSFVSLRKNAPPIPIAELRQITEIFTSQYDEYPLDPTYEPDKHEADVKDVNKEHEAIFATLQRFVKLNLVIPVGEEHMYYADYSGSPAHPGRSSAQPDRASAHLIRSAVQLMPVADQHTC